MSYNLKDRFQLRPDHWCTRDGHRRRVTLDHCFVCDHQSNCAEYRVALAWLDEDDPGGEVTE